jgi:hypothetical protein
MRNLLRLGGSFVCLGLLATALADQEPPQEVWVNAANRTISVQAEGSASCQADVMYVLFDVDDCDPLAAAVLQRNREHVQSVVAALTALGPPLSRVEAGAPAVTEGNEEGKLSASSDVLATLDVSDASKLEAARRLLAKIMDSAARCRGTPTSAFPGGG